MTVARSSASVDGWGMRSRVEAVVGTVDMVQLLNFQMFGKIKCR